MMGSRVAVTGALSYTGRYVASRVLAAGGEVVNISRRSVPIAQSPLSPAQAALLGGPNRRAADLRDTAALEAALRGCDVLYCTYFVRFAASHLDAAANCGRLFDSAKRAGVRKVVFTSHTRVAASAPGRFAYLDGKRRAEDLLRASGLDYAIARPCGVFGDSAAESILMNNAAWVLRRAPLFLLPGNGAHAFQPIHVRDFADLLLDLGASVGTGEEADACGPDAPSALQLFSALRDATGSVTAVVPAGPVPTSLITALTEPLNWLTGDVLLDKDDLDLLTSGLTCADHPTDPRIAPRRSLLEWIAANGNDLGREYVSSVDRHYNIKEPASS